jgi:hypothetical protein
MAHYDWLLQKLDAFVRKYYANQLLRGALILLTCLLAYVLTASVSEYFLYMPVAAKVAVVSLFAGGALAALAFWIIRPLAGMARLGKTLSHDEAASIVGQHFPEIADKLLNVLQLGRGAAHSESRALLEASIDQKAGQIAVVPITRAIDLSKNRRYLPYLLPLVLVSLFLFVAAPNVFRDAGTRLLQPTKTFERPAPFKFVIKNAGLQAVRGADFTLEAEAVGSSLPTDMSVLAGEESLPMAKKAGHFFYTFKNVTEPVTFRLSAAGFSSGQYTLRVAQKPILKAFRVVVDYPDYTGRKDEVRASLGDMTVPVGTRISWVFMAEHTDRATFQMGSGTPVSLTRQGPAFGGGLRATSDTSYSITLSNNDSRASETFRYRISVTPDAYPSLQVQEFKDTVNGTQILVSGTAGDDYGLSRLTFHYNITTTSGQAISSRAVPLPIAGRALSPFQHYFDVQTLRLQPGQRLSYWVEAWDNDAVHGPKAARSSVMTFSAYNAKQLDSAMSKNAAAIAAGLSSSAQQSKELSEDMKEAENKMLQSDGSDWESKQSLEQLAQKQADMKTKLEAAQKRLEEQLAQAEKKEFSEDVKEKGEELKEQMDNLLNKELKEAMEKLQELMAKMNKDQALQTLQQLEQQNKLFNMDLERLKELMKRLETQMKLEDLANKMDDLANKQTNLREETDRGKTSSDALAKEQKDLKSQLDKAMKEDLRKAEQESKDLKQGAPELQDSKDAGQKAAGEMNQASDKLDQDKKSGASQNQSKAGQNLRDMASALRAAGGGMNMKQIEIDIKATRQILTNLMRLSFDQEKLMNSVRQTPPATQTYLANSREQERLRGMSRTIRDSLFSLSKRVFTLSKTVNKETTEMERSMGASLAALSDRRIPEAASRQQYVMTHANNLALMLNELLTNLLQQQSQASKSQQQGMCNSPGGKGSPKPGPGGQLSDIITQQQSLSNSMQKPGGKKEGAEGEGQKPGGKEGKGGQQGKQGGNGGGGGSSGENGEHSEYGSAEQLARLSAQQAAIRRQVQQLNSLLNSKGMAGVAKELREVAEKMDRNETDLVNRRITPEFLLRQKEIMTRMLQAEQSLREQEQDNKRSSQTAQQLARPIPAELQRYLQNRQTLLDLYRTVPPQLKPYYRTMVTDYYRAIGNQ